MANIDTQITQLETWQAAMLPWLAAQGPPVGWMPPVSRLGGHYIPGVQRQSDVNYFSALRPGAIKVVSLDPARYKQALGWLDPSPYSVVIARDHPLSEQQDFMRQNPYAAGKAHAKSWADKFKAGGTLHDIDPAKFLFCSLNEPAVHNLAEELDVYHYTKSFLEDMQTYGLRGLVLNLSVGWPRNTGANTKPVWSSFESLTDLVNSSRSMVGIHEYWRNDPDESWYQAPNGEKWGWTAFRHYACTLDCQLLIGECGLTKWVGGSPAAGQSGGWVNNVTPQVYAEMLWRYSEKCDKRVFSVLPFTTNYESDDWREDDTSTAHSQILAQKRAYAWPGGWPPKGGTMPPVEPPAGDAKLIILPPMPRITNFFGQLYNSISHSGIDLSAVTGTPILCPYPGTVVAWEDFDAAGYGRYLRVSLPHPIDIDLLYGHCSEVFVTKGQVMPQGFLMAKSGSTGNSTGPHIHVELRDKTATGAYEPNVSSHTNSSVDIFGFIAGWLAGGNKISLQPALPAAAAAPPLDPEAG